MNATDNIKVLAKRHDMTASAVRSIARDLGLDTAYAPKRNTWVIVESAATVRMFNDHLAAVAR